MNDDLLFCGHFANMFMVGLSKHFCTEKFNDSDLNVKRKCKRKKNLKAINYLFIAVHGNVNSFNDLTFLTFERSTALTSYYRMIFIHVFVHVLKINKP